MNTAGWLLIIVALFYIARAIDRLSRRLDDISEGLDELNERFSPPADFDDEDDEPENA
jgi:hypothetical protein